MTKKIFKLSFFLLLGGVLASCTFGGTSASTGSSSKATSATATSAPTSSVSSQGGSSSANPVSNSSQGTSSSSSTASTSKGNGSQGGTSSSQGGSSTSSSSGVSYPDQSYRAAAVNAFKKAQIAVDINKLLGVSFVSTTGLSSRQKKSERQCPTSFADCQRRNARLSGDLGAEDTIAYAESEKTLISTKDYTFKRGEVDPYYYTGIKPDGTIADSRMSSPIYLVKAYGDTIAKMTNAFLASDPYVDYKTTIGNNDFLLHYDPTSTKAYLLIDDRDYTMTSMGLLDGQQWSIASKGRKISVTISYDASGKETLDAQAFAPVTYSANFITLFPKIKTIDTVYGAIHFVEGKSFDYLDQISPLEVDAFSLYYDASSRPNALMVARAEDMNDIGKHSITASLLSPVGSFGYVERSVASWYRVDGSLYEQNGSVSFYDKNLRKQFNVGSGHLGDEYNRNSVYLQAQTSDLVGWKQILIKDGKLYTTIDDNKNTHSYHHVEKMIITDEQDATHDWLFNAAFDSQGVWHQPSENTYGWIAITSPTDVVDFSAAEFTSLNWSANDVTSALAGANRVEKFANAIGGFGYGLFDEIPAADKPAYYAKIENLIVSLNDDVAQAQWNGNKDILRLGMDDLLTHEKETMITLSPEQIEKGLSTGFKDPSSIADSDAGLYDVSFPNLVFPKGANVAAFLAMIVVEKNDLTAPDITLDVSNVKRVDGNNLVAVALDDLLADLQVYNVRILINKVTLYSKSVTIRVLNGKGYDVAFLNDHFIKNETAKDLLAHLQITNFDTNHYEEAQLENLFVQTPSAANPDLLVLSPITDENTLLVDGQNYVYAIKDSTGLLAGSASVTITLIDVPYVLIVGDTSAITSDSTIRDLLACLSQRKIDPSASDVMTMQVMLFSSTNTTVADLALDAKLISGATYVVTVGDYGVVYDRFEITIA